MTHRVDISEAPALAEVPEIRPAPLSALSLGSMPTHLHFRRNHFATPEPDAAAEIAVGGELLSPLRLTLADLREQWEAHAVSVVLECAGHRRSELEPAVPGVQWSLGAVSEAEWRGARLRDVLLAAGLSPVASVVTLGGRDRGPHRSVDVPVQFARAISLEKALHADTLLAWEMNGKPIPAVHGGPIRSIVPGHYAVDSVKWLERITVLDRDFDGPFQSHDYRFSRGDGDRGVELNELPVHALLLAPAPGGRMENGTADLTGIAWGGRRGISRVEVDVDGRGWQPAQLGPASRWGRTPWRFSWQARSGVHTVAVRAVDGSGVTQPEQARWNALGYANNSVHRSTIRVS